jgi:hypothetical protein
MCTVLMINKNKSPFKTQKVSNLRQQVLSFYKHSRYVVLYDTVLNRTLLEIS